MNNITNCYFIHKYNNLLASLNGGAYSLNVYIVFSIILMAASVAVFALYQLWQGGFAGHNYMKNEYDIDYEDKDDDDYIK